jgi:hypothetical protein
MTTTGSIPSSTTTTTNQSTFPMVQLNAQQTRGQTEPDGTARVSHARRTIRIARLHDQPPITSRHPATALSQRRHPPLHDAGSVDHHRLDRLRWLHRLRLPDDHAADGHRRSTASVSVTHHHDRVTVSASIVRRRTGSSSIVTHWTAQAARICHCCTHIE